jgi:riboflavin kinase/FMN adenylyltransferase
MIVSLNEIKPRGRTAVTIGTFDGLHRGHQALIQKTLSLAQQGNWQSLVFAFTQPPLNYFGAKKPLILPLEKKLNQLAQQFDTVLSVNFPEVSWMEAEHFIRDILVERLQTRALVVGLDWRFGRDRQGDMTLLRELGQRFDFQVETVMPVMHKGQIISSTLIREMIQTGQVQLAAELLGYLPSLVGKVIHGDGRGRLLGYPTANLQVASDLVQPAEGVYAVRAHYHHAKKDAILYIGKRPTFDGKSQTIEVHLFETTENLYGAAMEIELLHYIRGDLPFPDVESLQNQIRSDVQQAQDYLARQTRA